MSKMCHAYESEDTVLDDVYIGLACSNSHCKECDHGDKSLANNDDLNFLTMDTSPSSTPYGTPTFSRESSFSSFTSCFSSLGDSLLDSESEEEFELQDTCQLNPDSLSTDEQVDESRLRHGVTAADGASFNGPADENISHGQQGLETHDGITKENLDATNIILDSNVSSEPHEDDLCSDQFTEAKYGPSMEDTCLDQSDVMELEIEEVTSLPMPGAEIVPLNQQVTELDSVKENTIVYNNILNTEPDMKSSPSGDSLLESESVEKIELQDTGQLNPDSLSTDEQVGESRLRHGVAADDSASFHVPADENISHGQQGLEKHGGIGITKENLDATNIILDSNLSSEPHEDDLCSDQFTEGKYGPSMEDTCLDQSDVIEIEEVTSLPMPGGEIDPLNQQVTELDSVKENTIVHNNILNTEPDMKPSPSGDSLLDAESVEKIELQDTGQLNPDSLSTDEQVDESRLRHGVVADDTASFHVPADENISHGQQGLETHGGITDENLDVTNIILDSNVSSEPHQDDLCSDQLTEAKYGPSMEDTCLNQSDVIEIEEVTGLPMPGGEIVPLNQQVTELDGVKENTIVYNTILNTEPDMKPSPDIDDGKECTYPLAVPSFDSDSHIWLPSEPANKEDDIDVASNNDDESDDNSTEWGRPNFSVSSEERSRESREYQLQKIMSEVMNGQFKTLVSQFLAAEGFSCSDGGTDKGWLDIVASLSWDAALLVKPDADSGNEMDPGLYVKVKCMASGSRQQSEVINGLVFKKSAAHKQMRTNIKHPKLLLLRGSLGCCSTGLSSLDLMKQESEQLEKTLSDIIEKYHPDVMLVEKAVSRNTNEYIQKQGVTVVSDMNIHRLERIARCTGSPIMLLQDVLTKSNLIKQCESIRFEKFIEEHNITGEDGRKMFKTHLFLEGFSKPLGCTILLKGATSEELKKIKRVLHFTVFAAYHLILETSFFADQKLFTKDRITTGKENYFESDQLLPEKYSDTVRHNIPTCDRQYANMEEVVPHTEKPVSLHLCDSEIKNSTDPANGELVDRNAIQSYSSLPASHPSTNLARDISSSDCVEPTICDGLDQLALPAISSKLTMQKKDVCDGNYQETVDDEKRTETGAALNTQDILISMSSQHIRNQAVCEQSHLSRITYYGYFDTSLGRYLQDTLLNEKHSCLSCGEPPESHMYFYTHHNGTLTVLVKRLPLESSLSGWRQGRIWMWTRCLRCNAKPTQRVIISSSARNLSFGKFLELSFSTHSSAKKLSTCGHLLHRDCLRFFGLGSKVAMFRYSSVDIYSAHKPPLMLQFSNQNRKDWLDVEVNAVHDKWKLLFCKVENILQDLESRYSSQDRCENANISVYGRLLLEVARMLAQEKNEIEVYLKEPGQIVKLGGCAHEILGLNWLYQQFFLGLYVWDVRLHHILQYIKVNSASVGNSVHESTEENELNNSESIAVRDIPSVKDLATEREQGNINSSNHFGDSCGGVISNKAQLTDEYIVKEHESPLCPDHDVRLSPASPGELSVLFTNDEQTARSRVKELHHVAIPTDDTRKWVWNRFSQVEMEYKKELQCGSLDKFHLINKYTPLCSSLTNLKHQMNLGYFIVGPGGTILSVFEEEISSIIAYALTISEQQGFYSEAAFVKDELIDGRKIDKLASSNVDKDASLLSSILSPSDSLEKSHSFIRNASTVTSEESTSGFYDSFLSALKDLHPEICVNNEKMPLRSKYTVVCIYAKQFRDLRKICCPSELAYISSISRCKSWNAQGGKSKVFFAKSMDDRFIIKEIKKTEFDSFLKFGLEYFKHFGSSQVSSNPTCLAKILGIYQVKENRNGKETRTNFMIMENLLFGHNIIRRYDLKGALFSRYVPDSENPEKVLLDQNFIEDMRTMPIYIEGRAKNLMERAIWNDASFLSRMNVMDYSLFVGVDKQKKGLVFGIIDYLRQYTWDKQLESWVKTSLVVPKNQTPTVISPRDYKLRFRAFISQYFLSVPDA